MEIIFLFYLFNKLFNEDHHLKSLTYYLSLTTFIIFLTGCSAGGPQFSGVKSTPSNKGAIYFYRPKAFTGGGVSVMVNDNKKPLFRLKNGQFRRHLVNPGKHHLNTDTMVIDKGIELDIEAGKTYYLKLGIRQGMWTSTWSLSRVFPKEALGEMKSCCKAGSEQ